MRGLPSQRKATHPLQGQRDGTLLVSGRRSGPADLRGTRAPTRLHLAACFDSAHSEVPAILTTTSQLTHGNDEPSRSR